jgi:Bacterial Ig domain
MQMSARAIIGIISICAVGTGSFLAVTFWLLILEELDRKRPEGRRYTQLGFPRVGTPQIVREYRHSYPDGKLHIYVLINLALAMMGMLGLVGVGAYNIVLNRPIVFIASPAGGASFIAPATIEVSAETREIDPTVSRVDFYAGTTLIGSSTTAPYSVTWSNVLAGNYSLTAKTTDDRGITITSEVVTITVGTSPKRSP